MHITFIGGGNMSTSLVGGLRARGVPAGDLCVTDVRSEQLERLRREFGVRTTTDNAEAVRDADLVVLAVKPQDMAVAAASIATEVTARRRVVVSIALVMNCTASMPGKPSAASCAVNAALANCVDRASRSLMRIW